MNDTIYALATGRPPAAIAIIRVSGPDAHKAATALMGRLPNARCAAVRDLRSSDGELLDQALVLRFDGPASATGEDMVELHCHGSRAVVDAVCQALAQFPGLRQADPGEFTRRAFGNGRIDLTEAEGLADLLQAETEAQRRAALAMAEGGLRRQVELWQQQVLDLSARAEAAIDYVDEDDVGPDSGLSADCKALASELKDWLDRPRIEPLRDGIRVVIAGPPNTGKSSLINVITGTDKAIVTDIAGTTRDLIEVPLAIEGVPFVLVDTAGLRDTDEAVERIGVNRARASLQAADIVWWLGSPEEAPEASNIVLVHGRADLPERSSIPKESIAVSAVNGLGLAALLSKTLQMARTLLPSEAQVALNRRQASALSDAFEELKAAAAGDLVFCAEHLRCARSAFNRLTGRAGVEEVLDSLFGRFCLGK